MLIRIALLAFITFFNSISYAQTPLSRAEVNGMIREFIEKNPEVVLNSIANYTIQKQMSDAKESVRSHTPIAGSKNAKVTIIEYSEFECPFCQRVQPTLQKLRKRYGNKVQFAFKHMPLAFHKKAEPAAAASQAAHMQGKFWEYTEKLWERQSYLGERLYIEVAKEIGLDMKKFNANRKSKMVKNQLQQDMMDSAKAEVRGTPFFLINGTPVSGALPLEDFVRVIEASFQQLEETTK